MLNLYYSDPGFCQLFLIRFGWRCVIYKKKVIEKTELSSAPSRAERLRRLRNLANLSRKELCDLGDININTYKGWELFRFGGLPVDGAEKVVSVVNKKGVVVTPEWLLHGKGLAPQILAEFDNKDLSIEGNGNSINTEFQEFLKAHPDAVIEQIKDDGLSPRFKLGDYVAGVKFISNKIETTTNKICIVQTIDGSIYVRYVKIGSKPNRYNLLCTNIDMENSENIIKKDVDLLFSAPVLRHYIIY